MYLITNRNLCDKNRYFEVLKECISLNIESIILREKDLDNDSLIKIGTKLNEFIEKYKSNTKLIINSNVSVYEEIKADGIHLPFRDFKDLIRKGYIFECDKLIGLSIHSVEEVVELNHILSKYDVNINYLLVSHIYETDCKKGLEPKGIKLLKEVKSITNIKIVALGGILPSNVKEVDKYSDDIAVMSTVMKSKNVLKTLEEYKVK